MDCHFKSVSHLVEQRPLLGDVHLLSRLRINLLQVLMQLRRLGDQVGRVLRDTLDSNSARDALDLTLDSGEFPLDILRSVASSPLQNKLLKRPVLGYQVQVQAPSHDGRQIVVFLVQLE